VLFYRFKPCVPASKELTLCTTSGYFVLLYLLHTYRWAGEEAPSVIFRSAMCKPRPKQGAANRAVVGEWGPGLSGWDFGKHTHRCVAIHQVWHICVITVLHDMCVTCCNICLRSTVAEE
jgi:hypothetical protein